MYRVERDGLERMRRTRPLVGMPSRIWSDDEWERIRCGYQASAMEEKWTIFSEGDVVYAHRSWTGLGYFDATFVPVEAGGWRIAKAAVARSWRESILRLVSRNRGDMDQLNVVLLELLLSAIVLGEPALELRARLEELGRRMAKQPDIPAGFVQHVYLGSRSES